MSKKLTQEHHRAITLVKSLVTGFEEGLMPPDNISKIISRVPEYSLCLDAGYRYDTALFHAGNMRSTQPSLEDLLNKLGTLKEALDNPVTANAKMIALNEFVKTLLELDMASEIAQALEHRGLLDYLPKGQRISRLLDSFKTLGEVAEFLYKIALIEEKLDHLDEAGKLYSSSIILETNQYLSGPQASGFRILFANPVSLQVPRPLQVSLIAVIAGAEAYVLTASFGKDSLMKSNRGETFIRLALKGDLIDEAVAIADWLILRQTYLRGQD